MRREEVRERSAALVSAASVSVFAYGGRAAVYRRRRVTLVAFRRRAVPLMHCIIGEKYRTIVGLNCDDLMRESQCGVIGMAKQYGGGTMLLYVRVGLRPALRLDFGKLAVAAGTRVPYASPGALT